MMATKLTALKDLKVLKHQIPAHGLTPNTSIQNKPLLIYKSAFAHDVSASDIEKHMTSIGAVSPQWRYSMYDISHFHTTAHEVLGIAHGEARLCFGHEDNTQRVEETVSQGDVVIIPAGVAHRLLEDVKGGFSMVGCYPKGCSWDMAYGEEGEEKRIDSIRTLGWFKKDPVYGDHGPAVEV